MPGSTNFLVFCLGILWLWSPAEARAQDQGNDPPEVQQLRKTLAEKDRLLRQQQDEIRALKAAMEDLRAALEQQRKQTSDQLKQAQQVGELLRKQAELLTEQTQKALQIAEENRRFADTLLKARQLETQQLQAKVKELQNQLDQTRDQEEKTRQQLTGERVRRETLEQRNLRLEEQLRELARALQRAQPGPGGRPRDDAPNPPAAKVEGQITQVSPEGLVVVSLGSDDGLEMGHTLEVFRLAQKPEESKYLGRIKIIRVTTRSAVGEPVKQLTDKPRVGDSVASRIFDR